jgi:hypothetical protein
MSTLLSWTGRRVSTWRIVGSSFDCGPRGSGRTHRVVGNAPIGQYEVPVCIWLYPYPLLEDGAADLSGIKPVRSTLVRSAWPRTECPHSRTLSSFAGSVTPSVCAR